MTPKYYGEQDPAIHGGRVYYPGGPAGYPLRLDRHRASVPMPRRDEYARARVVLDFKAEEFRTWEPASRAAYVALMDRVANRQFVLRHQERRFDDQHQGWRFWVEWLQPYETPAKEGQP